MNALSKNYKPIVVYVSPKIEKYLKSPDSDISIVKKVQYNPIDNNYQYTFSLYLEAHKWIKNV